MTTDEARKELMESLTEHQWLVIKLFISAMTKGWEVLKASLTPRQKELLEVIGQDRNVSEFITTMERAAKR